MANVRWEKEWDEFEIDAQNAQNRPGNFFVGYMIARAIMSVAAALWGYLV